MGNVDRAARDVGPGNDLPPVRPQVVVDRLDDLLRFGVEFFRGDKVRGFLVEWAIGPVNRLLGIDVAEPTLLTTSQTISLAGVALGVIIYLQRQRARPRLAG